MKKRSLMAAVAMMLVSAILLTGSTYAWFVVGKNAYVGQVQAKVTADDQSSVQVALNENNATWVTSLSAGDFGLEGDANGQNVVPVVDFDPLTNLSAAWIADYDGSNYSVRETTSTEFGRILTYSFKIRALGATSDQDIILPVSFNAGSSPAICGAIKIDNDSTATYLYGPTGGYDKVSNVTSAIEGGSTKKGIIDSTNDTITYASGSNSLVHVDLNAPRSITIDDASAVHTVYVYVWAEGQTEACTSSVNISGCGFTFGGPNSSDDHITLG